MGVGKSQDFVESCSSTGSYLPHVHVYHQINKCCGEKLQQQWIGTASSVHLVSCIPVAPEPSYSIYTVVLYLQDTNETSRVILNNIIITIIAFAEVARHKLRASERTKK